jgi:hypothetical protein
VVVALVAAAVIVGIVLFGGDAADPTPSQTPQPSTTAAVPQRIEPPVLAADPVLDGTTVVFAVENPAAANGDTLIWKLSNRPDRPDQHPVAVDVLIVRKGKTSEPLTACYPPAGGEG